MYNGACPKKKKALTLIPAYNLCLESQFITSTLYQKNTKLQSSFSPHCKKTSELKYIVRYIRLNLIYVRTSRFGHSHIYCIK